MSTGLGFTWLLLNNIKRASLMLLFYCKVTNRKYQGHNHPANLFFYSIFSDDATLYFFSLSYYKLSINTHVAIYAKEARYAR